MTAAPPPPPLPTIKGLPEGVELVHIGLAKEGEFELVNEVENGVQIPRIYPGPRLGASSGIIVKPADGYKFVMSVKDLCFVVVKKLAQPLTITANATFIVDNELDAEAVNERLEQLKKLPGYQAE